MSRPTPAEIIANTALRPRLRMYANAVINANSSGDIVQISADSLARFAVQALEAHGYRIVHDSDLDANDTRATCPTSTESMPLTPESDVTGVSGHAPRNDGCKAEIGRAGNWPPPAFGGYTHEAHMTCISGPADDDLPGTKLTGAYRAARRYSEGIR